MAIKISQIKRRFWCHVRSHQTGHWRAALLLLSPLLRLIAGAIALTSPGPVLFAHDRYGLDGRRFRILKFRTMRVLEAGDQQGLRRWGLDELPQLFNVLRGDMSLVDPRPHAVDHNEHYRRLIPGYMQPCHAVRMYYAERVDASWLWCRSSRLPNLRQTWQ